MNGKFETLVKKYWHFKQQEGSVHHISGLNGPTHKNNGQMDGWPDGHTVR